MKIDHRYQTQCVCCNGTGKLLNNPTIGRALRERRLSLKITLTLMAELLNKSIPYVYDLEMGKRAWTRDKIKQYESKLIPPIIPVGVQVTIYGLFNEADQCDYVGATIRPERRRVVHKTGHSELKFKVLQTCDSSIAAKIESDVIRSYKEKGFCRLNKDHHGKLHRKWLEKP